MTAEKRASIEDISSTAMFSHGAYRALQETSGFLERSGRGRLRLTGNDRRSYLQGLLTNDIMALEAGAGCYAAMLTPQGRMISDMRVLELGDAILIDLPATTAPAIRTRFEDFIFSEDVTVADVTGSIVQFGVYGPSAGPALSAALARLRSGDGTAPDASELERLRLNDNRRFDLRGTPAVVVRSDDYGIPGFDVFVDPEMRQPLTDALAESGALAVSEAAAEVCRIEAGHPAFGQDMDEDTIPLEAGIEDRAISQTKGCYVGQEIIIRVLHRGHGRVARRLVKLTLDGDVARGDRVFAADREVGFVTSFARSPRLGAIALGYVHRDFVAPGTALTVNTSGGRREARVR
jgi:folate-binding protein YgfZ